MHELGHLISDDMFWLGYGGAFLVAWRVLAGYLAHRWPYERPTGSHDKGDADWAAGIWGGLGLLLFWPLSIVGLATWQILAHWPKELTHPIEKEAIVVKEQKKYAAHMLELAEKSKQLELEHGIDGASHLAVLGDEDNDFIEGETIDYNWS